jgi:hypothetical protein
MYNVDSPLGMVSIYGGLIHGGVDTIVSSKLTEFLALQPNQANK